MMCWHMFGKVFTIEFRNGVGFDIEFVDSRPVWTYNPETETRSTMALEGIILLLPFLLLGVGNLWTEVED